MTEQERIQLAKKAVDRGWSYETLKYGDDLYGQTHEVDAVWDWVEEIKDVGRVAFNKIHP